VLSTFLQFPNQGSLVLNLLLPAQYRDSAIKYRCENMKTLTNDTLAGLAGQYFAPEGLYQYTKALPFLGTVTSNISSVTAGEWTEVIITYDVGGSGLADGAWIKGTFKFYSVNQTSLSSLLMSWLSNY
jgi:hypothetical protein